MSSVRPITGGTLSGPSLQGKVLGGFASPIYYNGGLQEQPEVYLFGTARDGTNFYVREQGVGNPSSWLTRVVSFPPQSLHDQFLSHPAMTRPFVTADLSFSLVVTPIGRVTGKPRACCVFPRDMDPTLPISFVECIC